MIPKSTARASAYRMRWAAAIPPWSKATRSRATCRRGKSRRLLAERPKARGLAVPGMPGGSPGMESNRSEPYDVLLVLPDGSHKVYARYGR